MRDHRGDVLQRLAAFDEKLWNRVTMSRPEMLANNCFVVCWVGCKYLKLPTKLIAKINRRLWSLHTKNDCYSIRVLSRTSVEQHDCQDACRKIDQKSLPRQMVPLEIFLSQLMGAQISAWPWSIQSLSAPAWSVKCFYRQRQFTHKRNKHEKRATLIVVRSITEINRLSVSHWSSLPIWP